MTASEHEDDEVTWSPDRHCLALDGVRGLAILAVTLYRLCKELEPTSHPMIAAIRRIAPIGERGVDLFFVLSGFLITGILLRSKGRPNYFRNFVVRRALRIFPLYFLSLVVGLWIIPRVFNIQAFDLPRAEQLYLWTYLTNVRMSWSNAWCFGPFDHFWSLAVEEHFYFVWPAVILFLSIKRLTAVCVGTIAIVAVARTFAAYNSNLDVAVDVFTFFRVDALAMGALLLITLSASRSHARLLRIALLVVVAILPVMIGIALTGKRLLGIPHTLCPLFFMAAMAVLLLSSKRSILARIFENFSLRFLGKYSYGMYVAQLPLVTLLPLSVFSNWLPSNPIAQSALYVASMFGLITCIAACSFHLLESHFLALKRYFDEQGREATT